MLITDAYRELNARQHRERPEWGRQSMKYWQNVRFMADQLGVKTLLDYGCGKQMLKECLAPMGYTVVGYDPAFPELSSPPEPHDFVVCSDVLEHVEPECIDAVLADLRRVTLRNAFLVIATRPSKKPMADGSNPHRIIEPREWWLAKLEQHFTIPTEFDTNQSHKYFAVIVAPK